MQALPSFLIFITLLNLTVLMPARAETVTPSYEKGIFNFANGEPKGLAFTSGDTQSFLVVALAFEGLVVLDSSGQITASLQPQDPLSEITSVAVSGTLDINNNHVMLIAAADEARSSILLRGLDPQTGQITPELHATEAEFRVGKIPSHLCFAHDPVDRSLYLYSGGEHGYLSQHRVIIESDGTVRLALIRDIALGGETSSCISDNETGIVYAVEPETGLWSVDIDPETDALRRPAAMIEPFGTLQQPVSVALLRYRQLIQPLVVDVGAESFVRLDKTGRIRASLRFAKAFAGLPVDGDIESIAAGRFILEGQYREVIAVGIQGVSGNGQIRLMSAGRLGTPLAPETRSTAGEAIVIPQLETDPAPSTGDAADDPAIWIHPQDPAQSLILGTDKNGGLMVMDMSGKLIQFLDDGRLNNVDTRPGFPSVEGLAHLAAATDRTHSAIALYAIDMKTRRLARADAGTIPAEMYDPYGLCLYRSPATDQLFVIATSGDGQLNQWRLFPTAAGKVDAERVRTLTVGTVAEGCVADDETGMLFVGEEDVGIWRYGAEPDAGDSRQLVATMKPAGELTDDVEGLSLYKTGPDEGYLVASSQGSNSYALYDRKPPHAFRGMFHIRANSKAGIDGVSETDGLDVTSTALPGYPQGLLVVQDGRNIEPVQNQNFKFVSWQDIKQALGLP